MCCSVTAASLCEKLKQLGSTGRTTVVCTIHQPQSKIYKMFDNREYKPMTYDTSHQAPSPRSLCRFLLLLLTEPLVVICGWCVQCCC